MVEYSLQLNDIFSCLADPTRRDILKRVSQEGLSVNEIAEPYKISLAAISKHLKILEKAKLIIKHRKGKQQVVQLSPATLKEAAEYLKDYEKLWNARFDALENYLNNPQA